MNPTQQKLSEAYQPLFDLMHSEHGLILLESELDEIIRTSQKVVSAYNSITKDMIIEAVCTVYELDFKQINFKSRKRKYMVPRQMIMYFLCEFTDMILKDIGKLFKVKYDHSTVIHHRDTIALNLTVNDDLYEKYLKICELAKVYKEIKRK